MFEFYYVLVVQGAMDLDLAYELLFLPRFRQGYLVHDLGGGDAALIITMLKLVASGESALPEKLALFISFDLWLLPKFCDLLCHQYDFNSSVSGAALCIRRFTHLNLSLATNQINELFMFENSY